MPARSGTARDVTVAFVGLGRVGTDVARLVMRRPGFRAVAAQTRRTDLWGRRITDIVGIAGKRGPRITGELSGVLQSRPDVVIVATTSFLLDVVPVITTCVRSGSNVICTAEELAFPWVINPATATKLDRLAKRHGVTILGAGANPGFITDALVVTLAGAAWDVNSISTRRVVRLSRFSRTVLRRLGIGYTKREFSAGIRESRIFGHIGYPESIGMVARSLGIEVSEIRKSYHPLIAEREFMADNLTVEPGRTAGFVQRAEAVVKGRVWFDAEFVGHIDPPAAGFDLEDRIRIHGTPDLNLVVAPGFDPQFTSVAVMANSIRRVVSAPPGLATVTDLPPATPSPSID